MFMAGAVREPPLHRKVLFGIGMIKIVNFSELIKNFWKNEKYFLRICQQQD